MIKFKNNPTKNRVVVSKFGNRVHPVTKKLAMHNGVDLAPLKNKVDGDSLYAVADGIVVINKINSGGIKKGYGNYIVIQHEGFATLYGHMMSLSPLKVGVKVTTGMVVGQMGTTGRSTGTHLHFGVVEGDYLKQLLSPSINWVDPELYLLDNSKPNVTNKIEGKNMKTLKYGSTGEQVKILQALLNIKADGSFGNATKDALIAYQKSKGLGADGICGNSTWTSFYYVPTASPLIYVQKIPFSKIADIDVLLHDKDKTYSVAKFAKEYGANICINGAMFDMNTYQNVTDLVIDGVVNNGGNYSNKGIAFENNKAYASTTADCKGRPVDFIGGAPILIQNYVKNIDMKGLTQAYYTSITQRIAVGVDDNNFYILTTGRTNKCNLEAILSEGLFQKIKTLINLDGGGSTAECINGQTVFTGNRNIPSAVVIKLQ